ncbi:MAG: cation-translocating P-type ATPase [Polyangiales bacterium]
MAAEPAPPPSRRTPPRAAIAPKLALAVEAPHALTGEECQKALAAIGFDSAKGLTKTQVEENRARFGPNSLPKGEKESRLMQFLEQFANPFVGALLAAAAIAVVIAVFAHNPAEGGNSFLARYGDAIAILLIVIANAVLGFIQEVKAEKALDALQKLGAPLAKVIRDGKTDHIPSDQLVPGDLLKLEAGDLIPADARLLQAAAVQVDESALTGESTPVGKDARDVAAPDAPIGERPAIVFLGTLMTSGNATAVVVATGPATELGRIGTLMAGAGDEQTPLEQRLDVFGKKILWACLALSAFLFVQGFLFLKSKPWHLVLLEAVSLAVAAIPEGLPAITTITLALGMGRMAERGAQVRKLPAVETLGSASVICSDKTGTLTQNEMTVREVWAGRVDYRVTGLGYDPDGAILRSDAKDHAPSVAEKGQHLDVPLERLLRTAALCNNARFIHDEDGVRRVVGDPTEGALLVLAEKGGIERESIMPASGVIQQLPFDSDRKRMTVVTLDEVGRPVAHVKGGVDIILPRCTSMKIGATASGEIPLDDAARAEILAVADEMAGRAMRVLALARRRQPEGDPEEKLTFLGLVGMIDPPRQGVKKAIATCASAGVRAVMITGDHRTTAEAIAKELGLWEEGAETMPGNEIEAATDEQLRARVKKVRVFARVSAEHKLRIVKAFKAHGEVVAMTGDGVNDAPAIREAQIGLAMGVGGTDVAREAADLVLLDNNFATIVEAIREGRAIYRNIQKFIYFLLSSNMGLVITVFATALFPKLPSLTPLQILWINLVTNGLPALALGVDPPDPAQMREPPRPLSEGLLGRRDYLGIMFVGAVMSAAAITVLAVGCGPDDVDHMQARAMAFSILAVSPLFHAFNCRSSSSSIAEYGFFSSRPLMMAVAASTIIHFSAVLIPVLQPVFKTYPMSWQEWLVMLGLSAAIIPVVEIAKFFSRAQSKSA